MVVEGWPQNPARRLSALASALDLEENARQRAKHVLPRSPALEQDFSFNFGSLASARSL